MTGDVAMVVTTRDDYLGNSPSSGQREANVWIAIFVRT